MKGRMRGILETRRESIFFSALIVLCVAGIFLLLVVYFGSYGHPYMVDQVIDISDNWNYQVPGAGEVELKNLRSGPKLEAGQTLSMHRALNETLAQAAIMVRANHQSVKIFLDDVLLYADQELAPGENPGLALHFVLLPQDYRGRSLRIELTSPYVLYAGRTHPILLGTIPALEAHAISRSMRPIVLMAMCLLIGLLTIVLTLVQAIRGIMQPQNLSIGVFSIVWALYYICVEYVSFQIFTPYWMSVISLGIYYVFPVPLMLYFYFSFRRYRKWMLPAVLVHAGFAISALTLQLLGIVDLPRLIDVNNALLLGLAYTLLLTLLEAREGNRMMALAAVLLAIAYVSVLQNFYVFYGRLGAVPYSYRGTFLMLVLCVLTYNVWQVFQQYHQRQKQVEMLALQSRMAKENYEQIKLHLRQVGGLKHEVKNHLAALQTYLSAGRHEEAQRYLSAYAKQSDVITDAVYHENFLINAVAANFLRLAEELGIEMSLEFKAAPIRMEEPDLYSLLSNVLENAIEGCAAVPQGCGKFIRLALSRRDPYLIVSCVNSRGGEIVQTEEGIQTGKHEQGHGYGLWIIRRIAEKYDGLADIEYDEKIFALTVALKNA